MTPLAVQWLSSLLLNDDVVVVVASITVAYHTY